MMKGRAGFTLVEVVLVAVIIGILAAMAVPRFASARNKAQIDSAARRIANDLAMLRNRARTLSTPLTMTFTRTTANYVVAGLPDPDRPGSNYSVTLSNSYGNVSMSSVSFEGAATITFDIYGSADHDGTVVLQSGGETRTVTFSKSTNQTSIQ